jgi:hypothetical protein
MLKNTGETNMITFDKVSMLNNIEVREKPNGDIIFWNIDSDIQLNAIPTVSGKFGEYLLFQEDRKDLSKFIKNKSELFEYIKEVNNA